MTGVCVLELCLTTVVHFDKTVLVARRGRRFVLTGACLTAGGKSDNRDKITIRSDKDLLQFPLRCLN